jgi:hypothetical protein
LESAKKLFRIFGRGRPPAKRRGEVLVVRRSEEEIITAVNDRIPVPGEPDRESDGASPASERREEDLRRLLRRLRPQIKRAGITPDEVIRTYEGPVNAIMLLRSVERSEGKKSTVLKERLARMGFKYLQDDVWVLPPALTPSGLGNQDDLKLWAYQNITKPLGKDVQFVLPFIALVDLKKVTAERRGIRKLPDARTLYSVLDLEDTVTASHIYGHMKKRNLGIVDVIVSGDLVFLASSFCDEPTMAVLEDSYEILLRKMQPGTASGEVSLASVANFDPAVLSRLLRNLVSHPKDTAQRSIVEAQFWMRFLSGAES